MYCYLNFTSISVTFKLKSIFLYIITLKKEKYNGINSERNIFLVYVGHNKIYHKIEAVEGGDECTFTEHVSDIVLPFFTYTSWEPHMVAAAAVTNKNKLYNSPHKVHNRWTSSRIYLHVYKSYANSNSGPVDKVL